MSSTHKFKTNYERMIAYNSILKQIKEGKTQREIAKEFGISQTMVSVIKRYYPKGFTQEEIEKERILYEQLYKKPEVHQIPLDLNTSEITTKSAQTQQSIETTNEEVNTQTPLTINSFPITPHKTPTSIFILLLAVLLCILAVLTTPVYIKYNSTAENVIYGISFALNYLIIALVVISIPIVNNTHETDRLIQHTKDNMYPHKPYISSALALNNRDSKNILKASLAVSLIMLIGVVCCVVFYTNTSETLTSAITPSILFISSLLIVIVNYHNRQKVKRQLDLIKDIDSKTSKPL